VVDVQRPGAEKWVPGRPASGQAGIRLLADAAEGCRGCELWQDATQVVFSSGPASARLMLVGEQPGDREDLEGEPFVGPAGRVLADALASAGIQQDDVYLTNAVKHFRFTRTSGGKRRIHEKPGTAHIDACHPWLEAELRLVRPEVVVCLGGTAGRAVLGRPVRIGAERGRVFEETVADARIVLTAHPSSVLRLRGRDGWEEATDQLVADLVVAASLLD
jgi:uracil-DNA glycosylase family protein